MITLLMLFWHADASTLNMDIAEFLLGSEAVISEGAVCNYMVSQYLPFIFVFNEDRSFHSLRLRRCLVDPPTSAALRRRLRGRWLAFPIELQATSFIFPVWPSMAYPLTITDDAVINDYSFIKQQYLYRCSSVASILKISIHFPVKEHHLAFMKNPSADHGLLSLYFVPIGNIAIGWRPYPGAVFGMLSICTRR
jgi:hypothetical protein